MSENDLFSVAVETACVAAVSLSISLIIFVYERALIPLYGSGPTNQLLDKIIIGYFALSATEPLKISIHRKYLYAAILLSIAPNAIYWLAVWTARLGDPVLGPAATHATALGPLVFALASLLMQENDIPAKSDSRGQRNRTVSFIRRYGRVGASAALSIPLSKKLWWRLLWMRTMSESQVLLAMAGVCYALYIMSLSFESNSVLGPKAKTPKKAASLTPLQTKAIALGAFFALWRSIHPHLANPVLPHPLAETFTHPYAPIQIHSAVQSITGLIIVGESLPLPPDMEASEEIHSARYLRASHSILGGVWMRDKVQTLGDEPITDSYGTPLGDSIYATFVLQEAVRLINNSDLGKKDAWANALVIGLGTGISTTSLLRHGIATTIVEIDPAVYDAARRFFGLPDPGPGKVFLEDARTWINKKRVGLESGRDEMKYDIVVHDCFSGGGVPEHIFTMEFWVDLKTAMHRDSILVVNFAGIIRSESSRMVVHTLEKNFKHCRAFHDMFDRVGLEKYDTEFVNMVFFCTNSSPLTFRKPRKSDYLGSPLRRHILQSLGGREVDLDLLRVSSENGQRYLLTDAHNPLGRLQEEQGSHHWSVMRHVLPDVHWETF